MTSVTIPVSTVPAVIEYLLTQIEVAANQDPGSGDFLVCLGEPSVDFPSAIIEVAKDVRRTVVPQTFIGSGGQDWLNESYDIDILVSVAMETVDVQTDPLTLTQRAWQLLSYVETAVRTDPSFGGLDLIAYPRTAVQEGPSWTGGTSGAGLLTVVTLTIHIENLG